MGEDEFGRGPPPSMGGAWAHSTWLLQIAWVTQLVDALKLDGLRVSSDVIIPTIRLPALKPTQNGDTQFTRVYWADIEALSKCRTGRAAAFYVLILRHTQLKKHGRRPVGHFKQPGVRIPTNVLVQAGFGDERVRRRATRELVDLGLIMVHLNPGHASRLELLAPTSHSGFVAGV